MRLPLFIVAMIVIVTAVLLFRTGVDKHEEMKSERRGDRSMLVQTPTMPPSRDLPVQAKVQEGPKEVAVPNANTDEVLSEEQELARKFEEEVKRFNEDINSGKIKLDPNAPNPWKRPLGDSLYDHLCFADNQRCYNDILMYFRKYADNPEGLSGVFRYLEHQNADGFVFKLESDKRRVLLDAVASFLTHSSPEIRQHAGGLLARYFETPDDLHAVLRAMRSDVDVGVRRRLAQSSVEIFREGFSGKSEDWERTYAEWIRNTQTDEASRERSEADVRSTLEAMRAREAAAGGAGKNLMEEIVNTLVEMLDRESDQDLRESIVETLGIYSGRSIVARDALLQRYASLDKSLRWMTVNRLKTDDPTVFAFVREVALRESDSGIVDIALDRMSWHLLKNEARSVFTALLSGDDEGKRHQALASLQRRSNDAPNDVWTLKNAIEDSIAKERSERNRAIASELLKKINAMLAEDSK